MKKKLYTGKLLIMMVLATFHLTFLSAQTIEWRLVKDSYSAVDPDDAGPAIGSVVFGLEMRSTGATINGISQISVGYSYQSTKAMLPVPVACNTAANPANIVLSPAFAGAGFSYTIVEQCNVANVTTGGQTFDRTASGTLDVGTINLTNVFTRVFTVTLWSLSASWPEGGYAMVNSGDGGSPGPLSSYAVNVGITQYTVNSQTYTLPLPLGSTPIVTPVTFIQYDVTCGDKGSLVTWTTATEINSSHFEIEKSTNGSVWAKVDQVSAAGNSNEIIKYQYLDLEGGDAFYRLKQVDLDGKFVYTTVKKVSCEGKQINVILYPVPTRNVLNVAIRSDRSARTDLQIFDMSGRMVKRQAVVLNAGNTNVTLDVSSLAVGEYILVSSDKTIPVNKKFTIAR